LIRPGRGVRIKGQVKERFLGEVGAAGFIPG
jgi:hypothetical protein